MDASELDVGLTAAASRREGRLGFAAAWRTARRQWFWLALAAVVCLLICLPIAALQLLALQDGASGLRQLLVQDRALEVFRNTIYLGFGAVAVALGTGTILAFSVWMLPPAARRMTSFIPVIPLLIPSVAHVVSFVFLFSPENGYVNSFLRSLPFLSHLTTGPFNIYTAGGIIAYTGFHLSSFAYLFVYTGLQNLGDEYVQAARANGAGPLRTLFTITLPLLRPVFVYATLVVLLLSLGQFSGPLMLGRREGLDVVTTEMYLLTRETPVNYALGAAYATPLLIFAALLVWIQHKAVGDRDRFVGKAHGNAAPMPIGRWGQAFAIAMIVVFVGVSAILPLLALAFVAFSPFWSGDISFARLTTRHVLHVLNDPVVIESMVTTLKLSFAAIAIVLPLGMMVAMAIYFRALLWRPLSTLIDVVSSMPLAIPSALIGFGFLFAYAATPFGLYGSAFGLVLAFVTVKLPFAVRYQLATLISIGATSVEASRANGASPLRTLLSIIVPLARTGVAAAGAVIFVLLIHEFGVAVMLRSVDTNVMSVVLFDLYSTGSLYPRVAAMALLMTFITMVGVAAALWIGGAKAFERV
jgi:iron(III) transport system permease protein